MTQDQTPVAPLNNKQVSSKIKQLLMGYIQLTRVNKPIGYMLLLYPTLISLILASNGLPPPKIFIIFVLGVFIMRSAGCIINDFADRKFDSQVARTKERPLASKQISIFSAIVLFVILTLVALLLVLQLKAATLYLAILALVITIIYPYSKRFFKAPQFILGLAFSMPIPMAYLEITDSLAHFDMWLLILSNVMWIVAYDTQYALSDRHDDLKLGLHSTSIFFANHLQLIINLLLISSWILFFILTKYLNFGFYSSLSLLLVLPWFVYQYYLTKDLQSEKCQQAFRSHNWVGLLYFISCCLGLIN